MRKALGSFAALSALALTLSGCETLASIEESILGPLPEDQQAAADAADGPAIVAGDATNAPAPTAGMTPTAAIASAAPADWRAIDPPTCC
jgi:hypothetical protein